MSGAQADARASAELLAMVERHRRETCARLLQQAEAQARELTRRAFAEGRERVQHGIVEVRQHYRRRLTVEQAQIETRRRQQRQHENAELLGRVWAPLRAAMQARWQRPDARRAWINALVNEAQARLRDADWTVEHPLDWPQSEQTALRQRLGRHLDLVPQAEVVAGLRVRCAGACVDGSIEGLLRDRSRVEALLLARLAALRSANQVGSVSDE